MNLSFLKKVCLLGLCLLFPVPGLAEIVPQKGADDTRVRVIEYNPMNVVKVMTFYGVSTHIQFDASETITVKSVGDENAWTIKDEGNHLFVMPKAENADTNLTVLTNKRVYHFVLIVQNRDKQDAKAWKDPALIFSLTFRYPEEDAAKQAEAVKQAVLHARLQSVKESLSSAASKANENTDYWVAGSQEISPTSARDDGRFIYLTFSNNRDMPAVYSVDEHEKEALINTNVIDGNTIVIHRLVRRLMLRKGEAVASVVNRSFDLDGGRDNITGTISLDIERKVRGAQ
jgi:type IV secretion system protein VirB9